MMIDAALESLKGAKTDKKDWRDVAAILEGVASSESWRERFETATDWYRVAASESGYSESILRRTLTVSRFLNELKKDIPEFDSLVAGDKPLRFSTVEVLKRIHSIKPEKAIELFPDVAKRNITHLEVVDKLSSLASVQHFEKAPMGSSSNVSGVKTAMRAFGRRTAREFADEASALVEQNLGTLCGEGALYHYKHFKFDYCSPDAIALKVNGASIEWLDGFMFQHLPMELNQNKRNHLLAESVFASTFFRCFWLVVGSKEMFGSGLAKDISKLGEHSIGVLLLDLEQDNQLEVLLKPKAKPATDRMEWSRMKVLASGIPNLLES